MSDAVEERVWEKILAERLIDAAKDAAQRTRAIFMLVNVAGAVVLCAQWSATFSWLRHPIERARAAGPAAAFQYEQLLASQYRDLYIISVPVLGLKVHVTDIQVFTGTMMAVLVLWWYYCTRRENHAIADLVHEARRFFDSSQNASLAYFYGVAHHFLFTTTTKSDTPAGEGPRQEVRLPVVVLAMIPVWVPLLVIGMDVVSLFGVNPSGIDSTHALWTHLSTWERCEAIARDVLALLLAVFCWRLVVLGGRFDRSTRELMERFGETVRSRGWTRGAASAHRPRQQPR